MGGKRPWALLEGVLPDQFFASPLGASPLGQGIDAGRPGATAGAAGAAAGAAAGDAAGAAVGTAAGAGGVGGRTRFESSSSRT